MAHHEGTETLSEHDQSHLDIHHKIAHEKEFKQQIVSFAMMIFLTMIAFIAVASDAISDAFTVVFIMILAGIQLVFQLYMFMHLSHKGHQYPAWGIFFGVFVAGTAVIALMGMIW